ncbi:MAG: ComF family protein [Anaerolineae bacterium]|nr:ComF family protein [Anaerolineae bacterium]
MKTAQAPLKYQLYQMLWQAVDWLYPPACGSCQKTGYRWCPQCQQQTVQLSDNVCQICGAPDKKIQVCAACQTTPPPYCALRSWGVYTGVLREAILSLKYGRNIGLGETLAQNLIACFASLQWKIDLIVPVPINRKRANERGYNQAALLALPLALKFSIPFSPKALSRIRETQMQAKLTASERFENVKNAFTANPNLVYNKSVLVIDDITTTGATMISCSEALINAGARYVYGLTLARTLHPELAA